MLREEVCAAPIRNAKWGWVVAVSRERAVSAATKKLIEMIAEETTILIGDGSWKTATLDLALDIRKQISWPNFR